MNERYSTLQNTVVELKNSGMPYRAGTSLLQRTYLKRCHVLQFSSSQSESFAFFSESEAEKETAKPLSDVSCISDIFTEISIACICVYRQTYTRL
jgi:hypothetical protein